VFARALQKYVALCLVDFVGFARAKRASKILAFQSRYASRHIVFWYFSDSLLKPSFMASVLLE
jgi:hypothetical protein